MLELLQAVAQQERWWEHIAETFVGGAVPTTIWMMENRRRARAQAKKEQEETRRQVAEEQEKIRVELDKKHRENTQRMDAQDDMLDNILSERQYIPAHRHGEKAGPLTAEGIYFPPRNGKS